IREHQARARRRLTAVCRLLRDLPSEAQPDRLHALAGRHGNRSERDCGEGNGVPRVRGIMDWLEVHKSEALTFVGVDKERTRPRWSALRPALREENAPVAASSTSKR